MNHEQKQHPYGNYHDQMREQDGTSSSSAQYQQDPPMGCFEFCLKVLEWMGENWYWIILLFSLLVEYLLTKK